MPFLAPIIGFLAANAAPIGAASAIAGAGTSIGEAIANSGGPPTPGSPTTPAAPQGPSLQQLMQTRALIGQQLPNVVGSTSGFTSPGYDSIIAQLLSGTAGLPGSTGAGAAATGQQFTPANNAPTNATVANQPVNLSDFLNNFSGAQ